MSNKMFILVTTVMVVLLLLFALYPPITNPDPEIGMFLVGEFDDNLVSDKYTSIFALHDGSRIAVDTVYAVGYDSYHVHVHQDPKDAITIIEHTDISNIFYIKRGTK